MSGLRDLRKRIRAAQTAEKTTFALKLAAASRFRAARTGIEHQRPYALKTLEVLADVAARAPLDGMAHPLLAQRPPKRAWVVVLASDRGLAGPFNARVCRAGVSQWRALAESGAEVSFVTFGRRAKQYLFRRGGSVREDLSEPFEQLNNGGFRRLGASVGAAFENGEIDACYVVFNRYRSVFTHHATVWRLLPIQPVTLGAIERTDFMYEPSKGALLSRLLPMYISVGTRRAFLESIASESAARMVAMDAANRNAAELVQKLTVRYNRARQQEITRELIEITSVLHEHEPEHGHSRWHLEIHRLLHSPKRRYAAASLGAPITAETNPSNLIRFGPA